MPTVLTVSLLLAALLASHVVTAQYPPQYLFQSQFDYAQNSQEKMMAVFASGEVIFSSYNDSGIIGTNGQITATLPLDTVGSYLVMDQSRQVAYVATTSYTVIAVDASGAVQWTSPAFVNTTGSCSLVPIDVTSVGVIIGCTPDWQSAFNFTVLSKATGAVLWSLYPMTQYNSGFDVVGSADDDFLFVFFSDGSNGTAYRSSSGQALWSIGNITDVTVPSAKGLLLVASYANGMSLIDTATGNPAKQFPGMYLDGAAYSATLGAAAVQQNSKLSLLSYTSQTIVWNNTNVYRAPYAATEAWIYTTQSGFDVTLVSPTTGGAVWSLFPTDSQGTVTAVDATDKYLTVLIGTYIAFYTLPIS